MKERIVDEDVEQGGPTLLEAMLGDIAEESAKTVNIIDYEKILLESKQKQRL